MSREVSPSYRYIVRSPNVRGGHARVEGTRIGVHDVIGLIVNGATGDEVCRRFSAFKRSHVYDAWRTTRIIAPKLTTSWLTRCAIRTRDVLDVPDDLAHWLRHRGH